MCGNLKLDRYRRKNIWRQQPWARQVTISECQILVSVSIRPHNIVAACSSTGLWAQPEPALILTHPYWGSYFTWECLHPKRPTCWAWELPTQSKSASFYWPEKMSELTSIHLVPRPNPKDRVVGLQLSGRSSPKFIMSHKMRKNRHNKYAKKGFASFFCDVCFIP